MSLDGLSLEEIEQEIIRRKTAVVEGIRAELEAAKRKVRDLEAKLKEAAGVAQKASKGPRAPKSTLSAGEKADRILKALDGKGLVSADSISGVVGFDGTTLRDALGDLVAEKKVVKDGKARGTKYKLA